MMMMEDPSEVSESSLGDLIDFVPKISLSSRKVSISQQRRLSEDTDGALSCDSALSRTSSIDDMTIPVNKWTRETQQSIIDSVMNSSASKLKVLRRFTGKIVKSASMKRRGAVEYDEFEDVDDTKWTLIEKVFDGYYQADQFGKEEKVKKQSIKRGIEEFKKNPTKYIALMHQTTALDLPYTKQRYTLIHRKGCDRFKPKYWNKPNNTLKQNHTIYWYLYQPLDGFTDNLLPKEYCDKYTDTVLSTWLHKSVHAKTSPILPGRGMGTVDKPNIKIIGTVDPDDVAQGFIGDCWLLSGISALAEFDGAIRHLFRKTTNLQEMPYKDGRPNFYTITLWDLETWQEVDYEVDERLCAHPDASGRLLGAKPSPDGELWVCYLEKALAIHCGGWDQIIGGMCSHAWSLLTGCKDQYLIQKTDDGKFECFGKYNPKPKQGEDKWSQRKNSPKLSDARMWNVPWPDVGGGGEANLLLTEEELFLKMCAWDDQNYIIAAGISNVNKSKGLVDSHAYSVIECYNDVAGTPIDLLKIRNPWGTGEIEDGLFDDEGYGWDMWPEIRQEIDPIVADDGMFYLTREEFFQNFTTIFVSASDMCDFFTHE